MKTKIVCTLFFRLKMNEWLADVAIVSLISQYQNYHNTYAKFGGTNREYCGIFDAG